MAPDTFDALVRRLEQQHVLEVAAVDALREENRRLSEELQRLQGRDASDPGADCQPKGVPSEELEDLCGRGMARKFPTLPNLEARPLEAFTSEEEHCSQRRRSFPAILPGMPAELCRPPSRRHNTYLVAPTEEAEAEAAAEALPRPEPEPEHKAARFSDASRGSVNHQSSHTSPIVPCMPETDLNSVEPVLDLPGMPLDLLSQQAQKDTRRGSPMIDSMTLIRRGSSLHLEQTVNELTYQNSNRQMQRFRHLMDLHGDVVRDEDLVRVMHKRGKSDFTLEQARRVIEELQGLDGMLSTPVGPAVPGGDAGEGSSIDFDKFVQLMAMPDLLVRVDPEAILELNIVRRVLLVKGADEVISRVTKTQVSAATLMSSDSANAQTDTMRRLAILNLIVGIVVVMSMFTLGMSMDVSPKWTGWVVLEVLFGVVFVGEVVLKVSILGWRGYLYGPGWKWNLLDCTITMFTLFDLALSLATLGAADGADISAAKLTLVLRALRLARIARLVKLLHTPLLSGLANMLAGFMVGVPCMLWVMVLMTVIFYVLGICFRLLVGPPNGSSRIAACGGGGDDFTVDHPTCQARLLYGEEYFGTLRVSMFTVFRCVLGDCSSQGGKSLTAAFSAGYGPMFDTVYCGGMVLVVFGLFNIIAAIFVETTISGLKYNNVQRKYARLYESRYVQGKLETLVRRIQELQEEKHPSASAEARAGKEFVLTEEEFNEAMQDDGVSMILEDLDIVLTNRIGLFDMFDCDNNGLVTVAEFVGTLMKVRGSRRRAT